MTLGDLSILNATASPSIWAGWFRNRRTWAPWFTFLRALFGLPLDDVALKLYRECTGRDTPPAGGFLEAWLICGRRAGKSFILALVAVYLAVFRDWSPYLTPGEVACVKIVACDRKQARTIHRYCRALLTKVQAFADLIERDTDDEIALSNGIVIEVQTASFRSARSYTIIAALLDEFAYLRTDEFAANPDVEVLAAIRPSMATVPGAMLLVASSPYARRGAVFDAFREHYGHQESDVLIWKAPTRVMNETVPQSFIDREMERDPARAAAEYGAEFRTDIEGFVNRDAVDGVVVPGRHELPRVAGIRYIATTDPSGSGADAMTLAISHRDARGNVILDCLRERKPPFSPEAVVAEFAAICKTYGVTKIVGDHWGGEFVREPFRKAGIMYELADKPKSDFYSEFLPIINSGRVELLDHPKFISQLCALERRTARSGKDSIDHPPGGHDDLVNVVAIACVLAAVKVASMILEPAELRKLATMAPRQRFNQLGPLDGGRGRNRFGLAR